MTIEDLKKIRPIPGFDGVKMKNDIQAKIYEEIKDMTAEERIAYFRLGSEEFRRETAHEVVSLVREDPTPYGGELR